MKKLIISILLVAATSAYAQKSFYNIVTKETSTNTLPHSIKVNGNVILDPSLKEAAVIGWREVPEVKAEAGTKIVAVEFVQDAKDPLKVKPVITTKTDAAIAEDKALAEQASIDAQAQYAADRQKKRDEITGAFEDKAQAEAIGKLFDLRWLP